MAKMDPNKYSKNANINPESKLSVLLATIRMGLMLIGIFGIAFEMFRENGWLAKLLGSMFNSTTSIFLTAIVIIALLLLNRWVSTPDKSEAKKVGDIPMYAMMAVGVYYLYRLFTTGNF